MLKKIPVISTDINGIDTEYPSLTAASKETGVPTANIAKVCNGKRTKAGGVIWRLKGTPFDVTKLQSLKSYKELFTDRANTLHKYKYKYIDLPSKSSDSITIKCLVCGDIFVQVAGTHLQGCGCNICASTTVGISQQYSREKVFDMFKKHHGNKYDYSRVKGTTSRDLAEIGCPIHGWFKQLVGSHRKGSGCPLCASSGFNIMKPATLYYLRVNKDGNIAYKIGITNRTIKERFGLDMQYITVLKKWEYLLGADALTAEQTILKENKEFKYTGVNLLESGNTELFTTDIGGFDG